MKRLLDLFCGAGGAGMGYARAGFEVVGVDIRPQPHYPFDFRQADALEYLAQHWDEYDAIHSSPPCQGYLAIRKLVEIRHGKREYPDLVAPTRQALAATGLRYVIENVRGAPIRPDIRLNGLMFGLRVLRERWFETNWHHDLLQHPLPKKPKRWTTNAYRGMSGFRHGAQLISVCGSNFIVGDARLAMGIDWMTADEIAEAIPPAYTEWIGRRMLDAINNNENARMF